jgi:hypothetical protein
VPAERIVPDAKEYILEAIDDPEAIYDSEIWDTPGFTLVAPVIEKHGSDC